jgi:PTH2 family peptidyl-tRNA hydrolase
MYAIVRGDLQMSPGKCAAQTGHAFLDTFDLCRKEYPDRATSYHNGCHGTKVILSAKNEDQLREAYELAKMSDIPSVLIIDSGHIMPPHFDGSPIVTALGLGPATREEIKHITKKFPLVK